MAEIVERIKVEDGDTLIDPSKHRFFHLFRAGGKEWVIEKSNSQDYIEGNAVYFNLEFSDAGHLICISFDAKVKTKTLSDNGSVDMIHELSDIKIHKMTDDKQSQRVRDLIMLDEL